MPWTDRDSILIRSASVERASRPTSGIGCFASPSTAFRVGAFALTSVIAAGWTHDVGIVAALPMIAAFAAQVPIGEPLRRVIGSRLQAGPAGVR
jgi:hypothetical protein